MKKTLVVLLALMMVFAFATTAMAADEQYVPYNDIADQDVEIQTAIERLTILGALKGYDAEGTRFAPSQLITREEFATIGVRIAGMEDQVALMLLWLLHLKMLKKAVGAKVTSMQLMLTAS